MTSITFGKQIVAIALTVLVSTACLVGAVGPAAIAGNGDTVVAASRA